MTYMVGKIIKLTFQRIQQWIIWTSQDGVITKILKAVPKDQQPRVSTSQAISWRPFHILSLLISVSSLHLSSRAVASIISPLRLIVNYNFDN